MLIIDISDSQDSIIIFNNVIFTDNESGSLISIEYYYSPLSIKTINCIFENNESRVINA